MWNYLIFVDEWHVLWLKITIYIISFHFVATYLLSFNIVDNKIMLVFIYLSSPLLVYIYIFTFLFIFTLTLIYKINDFLNRIRQCLQNCSNFTHNFVSNHSHWIAPKPNFCMQNSFISTMNTIKSVSSLSKNISSFRLFFVFDVVHFSPRAFKVIGFYVLKRFIWANIFHIIHTQNY